MKRESGYYWVQLRSDRWTIAEYLQKHNTWRLTGDEDVWENTDFKCIDETKIERK